MIVVGLNAYHGDASACLICNGEIVAAAEEERFRRVKHWAGFPSEAIRYCLAEQGVQLKDVDHIAINSNPKAHLLRRLAYTASQRPSISLIVDRLRNHNKRLSVQRELEGAFPGETFSGAIHRIEHHLAHLASAFLVSPFKEAVSVSVDGFGDFSSAAWGVGRDEAFSVSGRVWFPHSLGVFYQAMTQYLGFPNYGDEYKVMGLAPYGRPRFLHEMRKIVRPLEDGTFSLDLDYFRHHKEKIAYEWSDGCPHVGSLFAPKLEQLLGPSRKKDGSIDQRHRDLAHSVQAVYEEVFFNLLTKLHDRYPLDSVVLAGGCAMNSVANGKIRRRSPFKRVYVQSAAGDAGGAIGAAMQVWHLLANRTGLHARQLYPSALGGDKIERRFVMDHAYFGRGCNNQEVSDLLIGRADELAARGCVVTPEVGEAHLCRLTAEAIARGEVVGWFQGRMEWGPRALGNRSILCDPRRIDMRDILNLKIKRRESFRPFAPSILRDHVSEWFEEEDDVPFMMQVFQVRAEKRALIPAVTHVDGSGRLQTVHRETNPRYYAVIDAFLTLTGVPMVLNTSFNENEPIVCKPVEALDCFLRTEMDMLAIGDWIIARSKACAQKTNDGL
jgi:carbamoyltransferase